MCDVCHVFVCHVFHVCVMCVSCVCHVCVMCVSCVCHVCVLCVSRACHVRVTCLREMDPRVTCVSCVCEVCEERRMQGVCGLRVRFQTFVCETCLQLRRSRVRCLRGACVRYASCVREVRKIRVKGLGRWRLACSRSYFTPRACKDDRRVHVRMIGGFTPK